jgi:hypothetical protein
MIQNDESPSLSWWSYFTGMIQTSVKIPIVSCSGRDSPLVEGNTGRNNGGSHAGNDAAGNHHG